MPEVIDCPSCRRRLKLPVELLGQEVRCPTCGISFTAALQRSPPTLRVPENVEVTQQPLKPNPPPLEPSRGRRAGLRHCPECGAVIHGQARRCRNCVASVRRADNEDDDDRLRRPHRGGLILFLGIMGALCGALGLCCGVPAVGGLAFGIPAWVMAANDLHKMRTGMMDMRGMANTQSGQSYAVVGVLLSLLCGGGWMMMWVLTSARWWQFR